MSNKITTPQWPTLKEAAEQINAPKTTVENWVYRQYAPLKRKLNSRDEDRYVYPVGERTVKIIDPRDWEKVLQTYRTELPSDESTPELLTIEEVGEQYGYCPATLRKWGTKGVPELNGWKLVPVPDSFFFKNGTDGIVKIKKKRFKRTDLDQIQVATTSDQTPYTHKDPDGTVWLSDWAQRRLYEGRTCLYWRQHKCPYLKDENGRKRKIRHKEVSRFLVRKGKRVPIPVVVDHEQDVQAVMAGRKNPPGHRGVEKDEPYRDAEGEWYTARRAEAMFPVTRKTLTQRRTKASLFLGGRTIRFKPPDTDRPASNRGAYLYCAADIRTYIENRDRWKRIPGVSGRFGVPPPRANPFQGPNGGTFAEQPDNHAPPEGPCPNEPPRRRRGRPKGSIDPEVVERNRNVLEDWDRGEFGTNISAAARKYDMDRSEASRLINAHEKQKRGKNSTARTPVKTS